MVAIRDMIAAEYFFVWRSQANAAKDDWDADTSHREQRSGAGMYSALADGDGLCR